jgi:hypothetical protein
MRGVRYKSTLGTFWKVYRLVYERKTGDKINGSINRGMHKVGAFHNRSDPTYLE